MEMEYLAKMAKIHNLKDQEIIQDFYRRFYMQKTNHETHRIIGAVTVNNKCKRKVSKLTSGEP